MTSVQRWALNDKRFDLQNTVGENFYFLRNWVRRNGYTFDIDLL